MNDASERMHCAQVNEPWNFIPLEPLKQFYWDAYRIVRAGAKHWRYYEMTHPLTT